MTIRLLAEVSPQELLEGLAALHDHLLGYVKSMALKCAVDLGIPDVIHRRGGAATLADIATDTGVHPARIPDLRRLMDLLSTSGSMFSVVTNGEAGGGGGAGDAKYKLTTACRFLVGYLNLSPTVPFFMNPLVVSSFFSLPDWFRSEPAAAGAGSVFELAHGCSLWEMARKDAALGGVLDDAMVADNQLFLEVIILDKGRLFRGLSTLVDVGGGHGAGAQVIARAFPRMKCIVLDFPHVVDKATAGDGNLQFVAGDMLENNCMSSVPPNEYGVWHRPQEHDTWVSWAHLAAHARLVKSACPDAFLVTTAMRGYLRACLPLQALLLLRALLPRAPRLLDNSSSLSLALQAYGALSTPAPLALGASLHARALKSDFAAADLFVRTALVQAYAKAGRADLARAAFDEAPRRDFYYDAPRARDARGGCHGAGDIRWDTAEGRLLLELDDVGLRQGPAVQGGAGPMAGHAHSMCGTRLHHHGDRAFGLQ